MKRYFTLLLLAGALFFGACGGDDAPAEEPQEPETEEPTPEPTPEPDPDPTPPTPTPPTAEQFPDYGAVKAFPTAVGYGRNATGGRGGEIYHVTNLNDSGTGSLRDAVSQSNRIIVFDVAGVITLQSVLVLKSNQTLLFQTAPGDGIEIYNNRVASSGASNLIVRYMRVRTGRQASGSDNLDAGGLSSGENVIYDHCSFTWATDECFSISADNKGTRPQNITLQNSIIGQGCMNHSAGGLIQTSDTEGVTIYRNLMIDNGARNFKVKGLNQYVNNVVYNWGSSSCYDMSNSSGHSDTQIENNYFIQGPCNVWRNTPAEKVSEETYNNPDICSPTGAGHKYYEVLGVENPTKPFTRGNAEFDTYFVGNWFDSNKDGALNGVELTTDNFSTYCSGTPSFLSAPSAGHPAIEQKCSAAEAYEWIVKYVGASLPARDKVDGYMIEELTSLGTKGTIFRDQRKEKQYPLANTWQNIATADNRPTDSDKDGIPDSIEEKYGLDKNDSSDASKVATNGYTNIENYTFLMEAEGK